jgi:hypothetical protein
MRWETCPPRVRRRLASDLPAALLDLLAGLEGGSLQRLQLLSRGVVGRLHCLGLGGHVPQGIRRPESHKRRKTKLGANPQRTNQQAKKQTKVNSPSTCFFSPSRDLRASSA